jgi:acyl dehydratase
MRYFEDFSVGETLDCGARTVTREEIVEFARVYDPQPFHLDDAAAERTIYGGLIASGWQTASITHGLFVRAVGGDMASMGSPGVDELRWLLPVRPGDTLSVRCVVLELTPSRSKPDRGSVRVAYETRNQRGELVMAMIGRGIIARRTS